MEQNSKNYYFLKKNQKISQYISNITESLIKTKENQILLSSPIFLSEDNSSLITFFYQQNSPDLFITFISLANSNENKLKEIQIKFQKEKKFVFGEICVTDNKRHLIIFNEKRNKVYAIINFIDEIILNNKDIYELQENNYFEIEKGKILDIKFNAMEDNDDIIIYAIYCDNNIITIFNNKFFNKEFTIFFNQPLVDYQIIKTSKNKYDLFIFDISGNFRYIKNIQDIKNIPKSDNSNLIHKIEIYDKILYNINNSNIINEYKKCYIQNFVIDNNMSISSVIRSTLNCLEIGVLINDVIYIIKKYKLDLDKEEKIEKIIILNNEVNKYLIKTDKNIYLLDLPSLTELFLPLTLNKNNNNIKQDILLIINELISKMNFTLLLKLPSQIDNKQFAINYNFYNSNILCIKNNYPKVIIKVFDFEIESVGNENNNNSDVNLEDIIDKKVNDTKILMQNLLTSIEQEKEIFINNEINKNQKEEYYNKVLEEICRNINMNMINNNNINESIELMKDWYINAYTNIKLYGELVKEKYNSITNRIEKSRILSEQVNKNDEIVNDLKQKIENKFKLIEDNEKEISLLKKENNKLINDFYIVSKNNIQGEKKFANELIKRVNNSILNNIKYLENILLNNNDVFSDINFEQMKNFPLTMQYLDTFQKEKILSLINSINNIMNTLKNFHQKIKEKEK